VNQPVSWECCFEDKYTPTFRQIVGILCIVFKNHITARYQI